RAMAGVTEVGLWVRPELVELCRSQYPDLPVNEERWLRQGPVVLVNARWLPSEALPLDPAPGVGLAEGHVAYLAMGAGEAPPDRPDAVERWIAGWRRRLDERDAGGMLLHYLWDHVDHNAPLIGRDEGWFRAQNDLRTAQAEVATIGPADRLLVAEDADIEPFV